MTQREARRESHGIRDGGGGGGGGDIGCPNIGGSLATAVIAANIAAAVAVEKVAAEGVVVETMEAMNIWQRWW